MSPIGPIGPISLMKLYGIRQKVFLDRYSLKNNRGVPVERTLEQMWRRVAKAVASVEKEEAQRFWEEKFYQAMTDFKFVPGGRILSGAGTGYNITFYNCFVIPAPKDSRAGILETLKQMIEIMARGGGVGFNISSLRPRGARVRKVNGYSSGPINWAELFSVATKDIIQQGGTRRGALMIMLWDWHPDIEKFITVKQDLHRINGANLSLCVTDAFMEAVEKDKDWLLVFPDINDPEYDDKWNGDLEKWKKMGKKVIVHKLVKARKIWDLIAEAAWQSAEPGIVFMERYNKMNNCWYFERIQTVNPCGEQGLPDWGVCNLGSLNLAAFVKQGKMDYQRLLEIAKIALRFLDNAIDANYYFYSEIKDSQLDRRRTGLGTMGLADALIKIKVRYGSPQSLRVIEKIYRTIRDAAYQSSIDIAKEKGPFAKFEAKKYLKGEFIQKLPERIRKNIQKYGIRNAVLLTQAPTGSTSLLAGVSSGIEPVFEFSFVRRDRLGKHQIYHPLYEEWLRKVKTEKSKVKSLKKPDYFVSAAELTPEDHVRVQAVIQRYTDASISKTVNAPNNHLVSDVKKLYTLAYKLGLKGITYMREGSRPGVLERPKETNGEKKPQYLVKPRPVVVHGSTYRIDTPVGVAFITINTNGGNPPEPLEVFINVGKAGSDIFAMAEGLGRMISSALRFSSHLSPMERIKEIVAQLQGIGGARTLGFGKEKIRSLPDAIAKVLAIHYGLNNNRHQVTEKASVNGVNQKPKLVDEFTQPSLMSSSDPGLFDLCPKCGGATFAHEEGCKKCYGCGYSEC